MTKKTEFTNAEPIGAASERANHASAVAKSPSSHRAAASMHERAARMTASPQKQASHMALADYHSSQASAAAPSAPVSQPKAPSASTQSKPESSPGQNEVVSKDETGKWGYHKSGSVDVKPEMKEPESHKFD